MKILFIGNSYTYYNDLPKIFKELADNNEKEVQVDSVTKGGRKLYENLSDGDEKRLIIDDLLSKNKYDILFLQEQSYLPLVDREAFEKGVSGLIKLVGAKRNILYATWGRKSGSPLLEEKCWTSIGMALELDAVYCKVAEKFCTEVSHAGLCFKTISEEYPETDLYIPDCSHSSYIGSCVAAIAHYKTVFGEMPKNYSSLNIDDQTIGAIVTSINKTI